MKKGISRVGAALFTVLAVAMLCAAAASATTNRAAATTVRIWVDKDRHAAVDKVASAWARSRGVDVQVVEKGFGDIRDKLGTVAADQAPDVIVGAHDWTGELAANGLVQTLFPRRRSRSCSRGIRSTRSRTAAVSTARPWRSRTSGWS
jgi:maltose-binding protein MalE